MSRYFYCFILNNPLKRFRSVLPLMAFKEGSSPKVLTFGLNPGDPGKPAFEQVELFKLLTNKPHLIIFTESDMEI